MRLHVIIEPKEGNCELYLTYKHVDIRLTRDFQMTIKGEGIRHHWGGEGELWHFAGEDITWWKTEEEWFWPFFKAKINIL